MKKPNKKIELIKSEEVATQTLIAGNRKELLLHSDGAVVIVNKINEIIKRLNEEK